MRVPPFVVQAPSDQYFREDHCANCLEPLPEDVEGLFCCAWCSEIAEFVRNMRRVSRDGRINQPDVQYAVHIRKAHLLAGGYKSLGRNLSLATRLQVKNREGGRCRICGKPGTEVDHIAGSSSDLNNLQLLCADCHHEKTAENLIPATPKEIAQLRALDLTRVLPETPLLLADDQDEWPSAWRGLKSDRKKRFMDELDEAGVYVVDLKTRAEMIEARGDPADVLGDDLSPVTEDDDSSYGPGSYFARAMQKDD